MREKKTIRMNTQRVINSLLTIELTYFALVTFSPKRSVACWKSCNDVKLAISILGGFSSSHGLPSFQEAHNDILIRMGVDLATGKWKRYIFDKWRIRIKNLINEILTWSTSASICSSFWLASRWKEGNFFFDPPGGLKNLQGPTFRYIKLHQDQLSLANFKGSLKIWQPGCDSLLEISYFRWPFKSGQLGSVAEPANLNIGFQQL